MNSADFCFDSPINVDFAPTVVIEDIFDRDGVWVPLNWRGNVAKWEALPCGWRERNSASHLEDIAKARAKAETDAKKMKRPTAPRFSTDYAIAWGEKQGWELIEREAYDYRSKRHHDCAFGMDAIFRRPDGTRVGVQGAGTSERATHWRRFCETGQVKEKRDRHGRLLRAGLDAVVVARAQAITIFYLEFTRGSKSPVLIEQWA